MTILAILVGVQLYLGVEAWMFKYLASGLVTQAITRTAHVLTGSLVLAAAVVVTLMAFRVKGGSVQAVALSRGRLEGAA